jgi:glycosyltransferase involved in cell wall biosynthesis
LKISIVTAVYNREMTIAQAIKSVQSQSHGNIEHILQDGGSKDGSLQIINKLADANTHVVSMPDGGIYDAINKGISRATGDVIGLMHSDDYFATDEVLAKVAAAFTRSDIDGVYGDLHYVSATEPDKIVRHWKSGSYNVGLLARGWMPPHPTLYLRSDVYERFGLYDTSYRIAADYDAMLRYLVRGQIKLAYIPEVLVKMRVGGVSNRSLRHIIQKSLEDYRAIREHEIGGLGTLLAKNLSKAGQFLKKKSKQ